MRADRLVAALLVLQARGRVTAAEARTLFLVAGPASNATPEVKAALRKLVRALPETMRAGAEAAAAAVVLDPSSWDRAATAAPPHLEALQRAVVDGVQVELGYTDRDRSETHRTVHPLGLVAKGSAWYLVAGTDAGQRTFRVSRVRSVVAIDRPVDRPDGFDLAATWEETLARLDERRTPFRVVGLADPSVVGILRAAFGTRLTVGEPGAGGRLAIEVRGHSPENLAAHLAGFAASVEIVEPEEVRAALAAIGDVLVATYAR